MPNAAPKLPAFNAARPVVSRSQHKPGRPHTADTIRKMAELATADQSTYAIRRLATRIAHHVPNKDVRGELFAIYAWVRDHIRYRFDPVGVEWVQRPQRTVYERAGDCDDMATLLASLAGALGHPWRFYTVGPTSEIDEHIAAQADVGGGQWLTLDPVLEPMQQTTKARTDVGMFGRTAPGPFHVWDNEGKMLAGNTTLAQRQLWTFVPYFPQVPPTGNLIQAMPGVVPTPDPRYGSPNRPGFTNGIPTQLVFSVGEPAPPVHLADGLGRIPYTHKGRPGYLVLGSFWDVVKKVAKVAIPGVAIADAAVKVASGKGLKVTDVVGALNMGGPLVGKAFIQAADRIVPGSSKLLEAGAKKLSQISKGKGGFTLSDLTSAMPMVSALPGMDQVLQVARSSGVTDVGTAVELAKSLKLPDTAAKLHDFVTHVVSATGVQAKTGEDTHKPHPELAQKYGKGARQIFRNGLFYVYVPGKAKALSGGPTITFSLGASQSGSVGVTPTAAQQKLAADMVTALRSYEKAHGKPFYGKGVRTLAFQKGVAGLTQDGEYGPNAQKAGAWALGVAVSTMPAVAPEYRAYPVTWKVPTKPASSSSSSAASVTRQPPPAPAQPKATRAATQAPVKRPAAAAPGPIAAAPSVPGLTPVGVEVNNPGLAPATAQKATTSSKPKARPTVARPAARTAAKPSSSTVGIMPSSSQHRLAADMVTALRSYEKAHGKPLYGKNAHTLAFQKGVRGLTQDGEYGPNAQKAGAWALGVPLSSMPAFAPQYAQNAITWKVPTKAAAASSSTKKGSSSAKKGGSSSSKHASVTPAVTDDGTVNAPPFPDIPGSGTADYPQPEKTNWVPWFVAYYLWQKRGSHGAALFA